MVYHYYTRSIIIINTSFFQYAKVFNITVGDCRLHISNSDVLIFSDTTQKVFSDFDRFRILELQMGKKWVLLRSRGMISDPQKKLVLWENSCCGMEDEGGKKLK